jgi:DNA-binding MarR family transcriptional regulator
MTNAGDGVSPNLINDRKELLELSVLSSLESIGIYHLSEWDVLAFVYRHGASLVSTEHIARLVGYEPAVVGSALDQLERAKIIELSRSSRGVHFCRLVASMDVGRQRALQQLVSLSETRAGRVLLKKQLKPVIRTRGEKKLPLESEGNWLCLNAN